ncbi:MAG: esterase family protein, partial [Ignavibacterium sp.]|nr:esterase family protein [Ignavibacterium sp.]
LFVLCFLCSIIILSTEGCKEETSIHLVVASTTPSRDQLNDSRFFQFVTRLTSLTVDSRKEFLNNFLEANPESPIIEKDSLACFYFYGKASSVLINGDIQSGWSNPDSMDMIGCGDENFFYKIYSLPSDTRIDYQLIVDGKTITDPRNATFTPSGFGYHSQCAMPFFIPNSIKDFRSNIGRGKVDSLFFKSKKTSVQQRMIKVYTPAGYEQTSNLPTLYVNDGYKAIEYCSYVNVLDNLIADKKIAPVIVVFIQYQDNDETFFIEKTEDYITAICDELVPLIETRYKTSSYPRKRAISGISAGAHISILTVLERPDVFLNAAGQSTTITTKLFDAINKSSSNESIRKSLRFYFDVGRFDLLSGGLDNYTFLYANQLMDKEMTKVGINHTFKIFNDGHQWANWRERVDKLLIYLFGI